MLASIQRFKADIFLALSHPTRMSIVELLRDGEVPVKTVAANLGLAHGSVSRHLLILRNNNIVTYRRVGSQVFYSIRDKAIIEVLDVLKRCFDEEVERAGHSPEA